MVHVPKSWLHIKQFTWPSLSLQQNCTFVYPCLILAELCKYMWQAEHTWTHQKNHTWDGFSIRPRSSLTIYESLNGVDRQPWKKFIFYRQPSKMQIDTVKKFRSCFLFLFQLIVMVFQLLKNPAPNWKTSSHVLLKTLLLDITRP